LPKLKICLNAKIKSKTWIQKGVAKIKSKSGLNGKTKPP
jgi:hypothetical protein